MADDFLTTYAPLANDISGQTGLNPATVLGIIDTETGHGQHVLGNNIFGISPGGRVAQYPDVQTASQAFVGLMRQPNYAPAATVTDPAAQATMLVKGGYNTVNPKYAQTVAASARNAVKQLGYQDGTGAQGGDQTAQAFAPDYNNAPVPVAAPAPAPAPAAPAAPAKGTTGSDADFLQRTGAAVGGGAKQDDPDAAFLARTGAVPATTTKTDETTTTQPALTGTGLGGVPAESASETLKRWFGGGGPSAQPSALADAITSPEANAADLPQSQAPMPPAPSLEDIRDRFQKGEINLLKWIAPGDARSSDAISNAPPGPPMPEGLSGPISPDDVVNFARKAAATGVALGASPVQWALNALIGIKQLGVGDATTWNPATQTYGVTPEGMAAGQIALGGGLRFSGVNPLVREPPSMLTQAGVTKPLPVTMDELRAAINRVPPEQYGPLAPPSARPTVEAAANLPPVGAGPQPSGAQVTPSAAALMTPEEIATQRTVADKQWLNQTQQPGVQDTTQHIPGITSSLVEQEQTVTAARELKALKNLSPELSQAEREILDRNTELRKGFYADTVGSDVTRAADLKAANDKINTDLANVWQGKGEADQANVHTQIQTELAGSAGDLPPLKSAMKQVSDSLENAGTDPQAMYRTHRLINYLQSKQGQLANPGYGAGDVQAALTRVKATLANTIDDAAPGFGNAMSDYAAARGPIDAAKALQDRENGLYDTRGHMSFLKVHALMRDIIDAQKWDAPNNPLAGASDAQMTRLKALHDDLKKVASAKDLATAQGSDTAMNAVDIAKAYGKLATRAGVEGQPIWRSGQVLAR